MKISIFYIFLFLSFKGVAQLHSGTPVVQSKVQPVPNSSAAEKSASPQPINIPPAANPVPPIYPGAEARAVEIPGQLINPPVTPSGTQPVQKEPLSPVESTNTLLPNRPPRDQTSRVNKATAVSPVVSSRTINTLDKNYTPNKTKVNYQELSTNKKPLSVRTGQSKTPVSKKKPR